MLEEGKCRGLSIEGGIVETFRVFLGEIIIGSLQIFTLTPSHSFKAGLVKGV